MKKINSFASKEGFISAFTLAEMMVVMLILSIVLAAMAPVMTTRYKSKPNDSSPWKYEANNKLNAYFGTNPSVAMIGQNQYTEGTDISAKLLINLGNSTNFLGFKSGNTNLGRLQMGANNLLLGNLASGSLGVSAVAFGKNVESGSQQSTAIGITAKSNAIASTAVGSNVTASGISSLAVGTSSNATADNSLAIGNAATGSGASAVAIGQGATGSGTSSVTIGQSSTGSGTSSIAIGNTATGSGTSSISLGASSTASATNSIAIGDNAKAENYSDTILSSGAIAIGQGAEAKAERAIAIGQGTKVENTDESNLSTGSIAIGNVTVQNANIVGIGNDVNAVGKYCITDNYCIYEPSVGIGNNITAKGKSVAIGSRATANSQSIAIGSGTAGKFAVLVGHGYAGADSSVSVGNSSSTYGNTSIAIGSSATAGSASDTIGAIAIGTSANAKKRYSVAIGPYAEAAQFFSSSLKTDYSVALGYEAKARNESNIAIGNNAIADYLLENSKPTTYSGAIAIGQDAIAKGDSVAIGKSAKAQEKKQIVLGTDEYTVYIPGRLIVGLNSFFGANVKGDAQAVGGHWGNGGVRDWIRDYNKGFDVAGAKPAPGQGYYEVYKFMTTSDRRLKYVGKENKSGLDKIRQLKVFNYTFKKDAKKEPHVGVIAQDLQKVFPNAVKKGADGFLTIRMEDMFYAVINAIKELDAKYQAQEKRINKLEKENQELKTRLDRLEAKIK